jgi:hypothetical protein
MLPYDGSSWLNIAIISILLGGNRVRVKFSSKGSAIARFTEALYRPLFGDEVSFDYREGGQFMAWALEHPRIRAVVVLRVRPTRPARPGGCRSVRQETRVRRAWQRPVHRIRRCGLGESTRGPRRRQVPVQRPDLRPPPNGFWSRPASTSGSWGRSPSTASLWAPETRPIGTSISRASRASSGAQHRGAARRRGGPGWADPLWGRSERDPRRAHRSGRGCSRHAGHARGDLRTCLLRGPVRVARGSTGHRPRQPLRMGTRGGCGRPATAPRPEAGSEAAQPGDLRGEADAGRPAELAQQPSGSPVG